MYRDEMISEISMRCNIPVEDVAEVLENKIKESERDRKAMAGVTKMARERAKKENIKEEERYYKKRKKKIVFACFFATAAAATCATVYVLNKKNKIDLEKTKNDIEKVMRKYIDKFEKMKNDYLAEK